MSWDPGVSGAADYCRTKRARALCRQVDASQRMLAIGRIDLHVAQRALAGNELGREGRDAAVDVGDRSCLVVEQCHRKGL